MEFLVVFASLLVAIAAISDEQAWTVFKVGNIWKNLFIKNTYSFRNYILSYSKNELEVEEYQEYIFFWVGKSHSPMAKT